MSKKLYILLLILSILLNVYLGAGVYWLKVEERGFRDVEAALSHIPADVLINAFSRSGYIDSTRLHKKDRLLSEGIAQTILTKNFQTIRITQSANAILSIKIELLEY